MEDRHHSWLWGIFLAAIVLVAYACTLNAGFIWDDDAHLTNNPCVIGPLGFHEIWTTSHAYYYPLVLTTFWFLHKFVGLNPLPYHLLNVLVHAGSAILLWRVLRELGVRGAWFGAALWALHPVMVESVAWITELKNTQSAFFYLLSILFFLKSDAEESDPRMRRWRYAISLLFFGMAIASKSSTVMLPIVLLLCLWWKRERIGLRDAVRLTPFVLVSLASSVWTIWEQKFHSGALGSEFNLAWPERFALAGRDLCFYLGKLFWPHPLIYLYPRWQPATGTLFWIAVFAFFIVAVVFLLIVRATRTRPIAFAGAYFVVSLFPVLGFFNVYFFRYSFVSDHFQYLAAIGPLALLGSAIAVGLSAFDLPSITRRFGYAAVLITLAAITFRQTLIYHNPETLWRNTIEKNPAAWLAHLNLGVLLKEKGDPDAAKAEYDQALQLNPNSYEALNVLGVWELQRGRVEEGISNLRTSLKLYPSYAFASFNLGNALLQQGKLDEAITSLQDAVRSDPDYADAHGNLAVALSRANRLEEAVPHYKEALQWKPNDSGVHYNFGIVLAQLGRNQEAAAQFKEALRLKPDYEDAKARLRGLGYSD